MMRASKILKSAALFILPLLVIIGCGGTGGERLDYPSLKEGRFLDSAVSGLQYYSGNQSGITDPNGTFVYEDNEIVSFFIGNIFIGETIGKSIITPVDLDPNGAASHRKVINIARFLLTLDCDADPNNGIDIPAGARIEADGVSIDFDVPVEEFENSTVGAFICLMVNESILTSAELASPELAQNHLQQTLDMIALEGLDSTVVDFSDYFPTPIDKYCLKTFEWTYGESGQYVSEIEGTESVSYLSGEIFGVRIRNFPDSNSIVVYDDGSTVKVLGFDEYYLSTDCSLTDHPMGWSFDNLYDGMVMDQGTHYLVKNDMSDCRESENNRRILINIQDIKVLNGDYEDAVIMWHIDSNNPFAILDFHGKERDLAINLPRSRDTGGYSVTGFEIYGFGTGPIAAGDIDAYTGSLIDLSELVSVFVVNVGIVEDLSGNTQVTTVRSSPDAEQTEVDVLIAGLNAFSFDLYRKINEGDENNRFFSPYTVSVSMAMLYAGARGDTGSQLWNVLRFGTEQDRLHPVFNALDLFIDPQVSIGAPGACESALRTETAAWGQDEYPALIDFYNLLAANYCGQIQPLDFKYKKGDSEGAIEDWVSGNTEGLITDAATSVTNRVRLALTAASTLDGVWALPFDPNSIFEGYFELASGEKVAVPMMTLAGSLPFNDEEGYQAVELAFKDGNLAMLVLIPDSGGFYDFEDALDLEEVERIIGRLETQTVTLTLPLFSFTSGADLISAFSSLGATDAKLEGQADFSGVNKVDELYLNGNRYNAHITISETGAKGAGSSVVTMEGREELPEPVGGSGGTGVIYTWESPSDNEPVYIFDPNAVIVPASRPFIFIIRDAQSGIILFMGRLMDPSD